MNAEILAIGDEITGGQLLDTNSQWLSQRLGEVGVRVLYHSTVGDELQPCIDVFRRAIQRADVVISTGGLGPTADDLTRQALAAAVDRPLVTMPEALEHIRQLFARREREMPKSNELQAFFPAGSRVVPNPNGTAPGIDLDVPRTDGGRCRFFALPGVPAEMREMWQGYLHTALRGMGAGDRVILRRNIKCFGTGESQLESLMPDLIRRGRIPRVGINASRATIILRIVAEGDSEEHCRAQIEPTVAEIHKQLGTLVYGEGDDELQDVVLRLLGQRGQTLASAEIATAGLVTQWLARAGAGDGHYRGGLVAVDETAMARLLSLNSAAPSHNGKEFARAMAIACREQFQTDFGLAIGPLPSVSDTGEAQQVHFTLAAAAGVKTFHVSSGIHPDIVGDYCAKHAINLARLIMLKQRS
ncbi:MAG: CinA family nicotinamide mononucleotide deamidase-related protein [Thermoguttaceae bacterium]